MSRIGSCAGSVPIADCEVPGRGTSSQSRQPSRYGRIASGRSCVLLSRDWGAVSMTSLAASDGHEPIGVARIGADNWGPNLARNFAASGQFRLVWLADLDEYRARQAIGSYSTVQTTADLGVVLADERVAAVAIATPAATHLAIALEALRAGKHVLIEKPIAA